jgi:hypothetical protein
MSDAKLPDCMMPDGGEPCIGYQQLRAEVEELSLEIARLRRSQAMIVEQSARLREELARARGYDTWADMRRAELMEQSE